MNYESDRKRVVSVLKTSNDVALIKWNHDDLHTRYNGDAHKSLPNTSNSLMRETKINLYSFGVQTAPDWQFSTAVNKLTTATRRSTLKVIKKFKHGKNSFVGQRATGPWNWLIGFQYRRQERTVAIVWILISWRQRNAMSLITKKTSDCVVVIPPIFNNDAFGTKTNMTMTHSDPSLSENNRINAFCRAKEKIMSSPETWFH